MDSAELRAVQQPLKDAYREDPEKAVVTLRARGQLDDAIACSVETGRALAVAGLHPASGGDGSLLCSGDMLLQGAQFRAVHDGSHLFLRWSYHDKAVQRRCEAV